MAKRNSASFAEFLAKANASGVVIEFGGAKVKVRNMPVAESLRYGKMYAAAQAAGDLEPFLDKLGEVFLEYATDVDTGESFDSTPSEISNTVPQGLLFRVYQAAATPDIERAAKN